MPKRCNSQGDHIGTSPKLIPIKKFGALWVFHCGTGTGHRITRRLQTTKSLSHPASLGWPIGDWGTKFALFFHRLINGGIVRNFHLIDRHAIGCQFHHPFYTFRPIFICLLEHTGNQIDVYIFDPRILCPLESTKDFSRPVSPSIGFQYMIRKIFNSQTQTGNSKVSNRLYFFFCQGTGLAFKGNFFRLIPGQNRFHTIRKFG